MRRIPLLVATAALLAAVPLAAAARGGLDPGFGESGRVTTAVGARAAALAVAVEPDGRIVVAGATGRDEGPDRLLLARYLPDGTLDRGFGEGGVVVAERAPASALALQRGGRILVLAGDAVLGFRRDGTPDPQFAAAGALPLPPAGGEAQWLVPLPDGRFVVAGNTAAGGGARELRLLRFHASGAPDPTFGNGGTAAVPAGWTALSAAAARSGAIVLAGSWWHPEKTSAADGRPAELRVARVTSAGVLDRRFGRGGLARHAIDARRESVGPGLAVQRDGRIVVGGRMDACCGGVWRLRADGTLDAGFGRGGAAATAPAPVPGGTRSRVYLGGAVAVDRGGRIVLASHDDLAPDARFGVARFTPAGRTDPRFGDGGAVSASFSGGARPWALALGPDGKVVLAGSYLTGPGNPFSLDGPRAAALARVLVPPCVVPRLRSRTQAGAAAALRSAGCTPGRVTTVRSGAVPAGRVVSQGRPPLTSLPEDAPVSFAVSRGPRRP